MAKFGNQYLGSTDAQVLPILVMEIVYLCMYVCIYADYAQVVDVSHKPTSTDVAEI